MLSSSSVVPERSALHLSRDLSKEEQLLWFPGEVVEAVGQGFGNVRLSADSLRQCFLVIGSSET